MYAKSWGLRQWDFRVEFGVVLIRVFQRLRMNRSVHTHIPHPTHPDLSTLAHPVVEVWQVHSLMGEASRLQTQGRAAILVPWPFPGETGRLGVAEEVQSFLLDIPSFWERSTLHTDSSLKTQQFTTFIFAR